MSEKTIARPPRDNLCRALPRSIELREAADGSDEAPVLSGHFARFNEWTEIESFWEGRFMERIAPGAFKKTFRERTPKVLFNHGHDPTMGDQILGSVRDLHEDTDGAYYEVDLFDGMPPMLLSGLRAGAYGASFRFSVVREEFDNDPGVSDHNPEGIPERTIKEARVPEFGPVSFPAYEGATAQARSTTDEYLIERLERADPERFRALIEQHQQLQRATEPVEDEQATDEPDDTQERATGPGPDETATDETAPALATPSPSTVAPSGPLTPLRGMTTTTRKERTRL